MGQGLFAWTKLRELVTLPQWYTHIRIYLGSMCGAEKEIFTKAQMFPCGLADVMSFSCKGYELGREEVQLNRNHLVSSDTAVEHASKVGIMPTFKTTSCT